VHVRRCGKRYGGGTEEKTFKDDKPDIARCMKVLRNVWRAFEPTLRDRLVPNRLIELTQPTWLIKAK
jgi:hypothetical protein